MATISRHSTQLLRPRLTPSPIPCGILLFPRPQNWQRQACNPTDLGLLSGAYHLLIMTGNKRLSFLSLSFLLYNMHNQPQGGLSVQCDGISNTPSGA